MDDLDREKALLNEVYDDRWEVIKNCHLSPRGSMVLFELGCLCDKYQTHSDVDYCSMFSFDLCFKTAHKYSKLEFDSSFYYELNDIFKEEILPKLKAR